VDISSSKASAGAQRSPEFADRTAFQRGHQFAPLKRLQFIVQTSRWSVPIWATTFPRPRRGLARNAGGAGGRQSHRPTDFREHFPLGLWRTARSGHRLKPQLGDHPAEHRLRQFHIDTN